MTTPSGNDLTEVASACETCLRELTGQSQSKKELTATLDCSRSTVDRNLRYLSENNLVEYSNGVWQVTRLGKCVYNTRDSYLTDLRTLSNAAPLLDALPANSPIETIFFKGAEIHEAGSTVPDAVGRVLLQSFENATEICGFTPLALVSFAESIYESVTMGNGYQFELVLPEPVFSRLKEIYPEQVDEVVRDSSFMLYRGEIPVSFGLWIADSRQAGMIIYAERGIRGIVVNESEDAVEWASSQYRRVKQNADPAFSRSQMQTQ